MATEPHDQLDRLASDNQGIYADAVRWFAAQGAAAAPVLVAGLDDERLGSVAHWRILLLLRQLRIPSTLPAVLEAFRKAMAKSDVIVLPGALEALAAFEDDEATSALASVLESSDLDSINHAAVLLAAKGGAVAEAALRNLLGRPEAAARRSAVRGLLKIDTDSARTLLRDHKRREQDAGVLELLKGVS